MQEEFNNNVEEQFQTEFTQPENPEYANPYVMNEPTPVTPAPKSNMIAGIVGAFLGSLIGCVLWIIIYNLGYIAGIAGLVIGVCALKGYELLGKHLDMKGAIITLVLMIVMIYFANKLAWSLSAYEGLKSYDWTFAEVYQNMDYILEQTELTASYYGDLAIGYVLTAASSYKFVIDAFKSAKSK